MPASFGKVMRRSMLLSERYTLADGTAIPKLGLGTWLLGDDKAYQAVVNATGVGYRMIDTAQSYGNERGVGEGVRNCGITREELFVASKVAAERKDYDTVLRSIDRSLTMMGLDYLDQMIIHSPQPWIEVNQSDNRYEAENLEVWRALVDARQAGKVRVIGVSNFNEHDLTNILDNSDATPQVNQVLAHVSNTPFELIRFCQDHGIQVEAYSPIAHGMVLKNPQIAKVAKKYHASVAQLCVRYDIQLGLVALPKTTSVEHLRDNADVDFTISDDDMQSLKSMERIKDYGASSLFPVYGGKL